MTFLHTSLFSKNIIYFIYLLIVVIELLHYNLFKDYNLFKYYNFFKDYIFLKYCNFKYFI